MVHEHASPHIKGYRAINITNEGLHRDDVDDNPSYIAQRIIGLIFGVFEAVLAIRLVLSLIGASVTNIFTEFIYSVTQPLISPFYGVLGRYSGYKKPMLEIEVVIAILVYALIGWLIVKIINAAQDRR